MASNYGELMDEERSSGETLAPTEPVNPYGSLMDQEDQEQRRNLKQSMIVAGESNPDRAANVLKLSKEMNLPSHIVESSYDEIVKKRAAQKDYDSLIRDTPGLAKFLENPDNAKIAHDDLDPLKRIDKGARTFKAKSKPNEDSDLLQELSRAGQTGWNNVGSSVGHLAAAYGKGDPRQMAEFVAEQNRKANDLRAKMPDYAKEFNDTMDREGKDVTKAFNQFRGSFGSMRDGKILEGLKDFAAGGGKTVGETLDMIAAAAVRPGGLSYMTTENLANSLPSLGLGLAGAKGGAMAGAVAGPKGVVVGATAGMMAGTFAGSSATEIGAQINDSLQKRGYDVTNPDDIMRAYSDPKLMAEIRGEAERKGLTTAAVDGLFSAVAGKFIKAGKPGVIGKTTGAIKDVGVQSVGEFSSEFAGQVAREKGDLSKTNIGEAVLEGITSLGQSTGESVIGATTKSIRATLPKDTARAAEQLAGNTQKAIETQEKVKTLSEIGEAVRESKTSQRSPEKIQELVDVATGDDQARVYFQTDEWDNYWTGQGESPAQMAEQLLGDQAKAYFEAKQSGIPMEIPLGSYVSKLATTDHYEGLLSIVRTEPDGQSFSETNEHFKSLGPTLEELANEATNPGEVSTEPVVQDAPQQQMAPEITQQLIEQLQTANVAPEEAKFVAQVIEQGFSNLSNKARFDLNELVKKFLPSFRSAENLGTEELSYEGATAARPSFEDMLSGLPGPAEQSFDENGNLVMDPGILTTLRRVINDSELIKNSAKFDDAGEAIGGIAGASTFPGFFQDKGYKRKEVLNIIDKHLSGESLTEKQTAILNDLYSGMVDSFNRKEFFQSVTPSGPIEIDGLSFDHSLPDGAEITLQYTPTPGLSPVEREAETYLAWILSQPDAIERYAELPDSQGGKVISADTVKEMLPAFRESKKGATLFTAATHGPSAAFAWKLFEERLNQDPTSFVLFTGGGTGAGKSSSMARFEMVPVVQSTEFVYDSTMARMADSVDKIEKSLQSGRPVQIMYVYRPVLSAADGIAERFDRTGRSIPDWAATGSHIDALDTIIALHDKYKDNQAVVIHLYDNSGAGPVPTTVDNLRELSYTKGKTRDAAVQEILPQVTERLKRVSEEIEQVRSEANRAYEARNQSGADGQGQTGIQADQRTDGQGGRDNGDGSQGQSDQVKKFDQSITPPAPPFYSKLEKLIESKMGNSADVDQIKAMIRDIKEEERKWSGIDDFLKDKKKVNKAELLDFLRANQLEIQEVTKADDASALTPHESARLDQLQIKFEEGTITKKEQAEFDDLTSRDKGEESYKTKFGQYTLPGGENYREILFTLPTKETEFDDAKFVEWFNTNHNAKITSINDLTGLRPSALRRFQEEGHGQGYSSNHWDEKNVLAHTRLKDYTGADGKRVLLVEEVQSDWHQAGRKNGYKGDHTIDLLKEKRDAIETEMDKHPNGAPKELLDEYGQLTDQIIAVQKGVPDAPFKKTWHEFVMKRLIRMAAEQGYDRIAWTPGVLQAERYDLSKQIDEINYGKIPKDESSVWIRIYDKSANLLPLSQHGFEVYKTDDDGNQIHKVPKDKLEDIVGKEIAERIINREGVKSKSGGMSLKDTGLKVGGEGMKGFYDKILVDFTNKFVKKYGAKVGETNIGDISKKLTTKDITSTRSENGIWIVKFDDGVIKRYPELEVPKLIDAQKMAVDERNSLRVAGDAAENNKVHSVDITPQLKDAALTEGFSLFQSQGGQARGQIRFGKQGVEILLDKMAKNESTHLHEIGHLYLEIMSFLADQDTTPQKLKDDFQEILKWLEVKDRSQIKVEHHEKWARGWEAYLRTGKAPSKKLRAAFHRFKMWLKRLYSKSEDLGVNLTPEIVGVMNRILATDEEINAVYQEQSVEPLFGRFGAMKMSDEKAEKYEAAVTEAQQVAEEILDAKMMKDYDRQQEAWYKDAKKEVTEKIEADLNSRPVYRALSILQKGKLPDGSPLPAGMEPIKISKESLVRAYGKDFLNSLPKPHVYTIKDNGLDFNVVAEMLGFQSGDQMMQEIKAAPKKEELLKQMVDQKMQEKYPDLLKDMKARREEAQKALHNEKRSEVLKMEIDELLFLANNHTSTTKDVIKRVARRTSMDKGVREHAERIIARRKVRELNANLFRLAEIKYARLAGEALAKGDFDAALDAKQKELLNHELFRATNEARETIDKALTKFKKLKKSDEDLAKSRDMDLVNTARAILSLFGLGSADKPAIAYVEQIQKYDPETYETVKTLIESSTQRVGPYKDISFDDFVAMRDSVDALWELAKSSRQIEIDGQTVNREDIQRELEQQILEVSENKMKPGYHKAVGRWEKVRFKLLSAKAALTRAEAWVEAMDLGDPTGPFRSYFWNPVKQATVNYRLKKAQVLQKYRGILEDHAKHITREKIAAPELKYTFKDKTELLMAILHSGNESNLRKLLLGRYWGDQDSDGNLDTTKWNQFINRMWSEGVLKKEDYEFAQKIWDLMDEMKPDAQRAHKKMHGYYFNEITANPVKTPFGEFRGGYVPAKVDIYATEDGALRAEKDALENNNNSFQFPTTGRGFTKSRVNQYAAPLSLEFSLLGGHIDGVLRFTYIEPSVRQVARIVQDKGFRQTLAQLDETVGRELLMPWLQRSAQQKVVFPSNTGIGKLLDPVAKYLRKSVAMQMMVGNFTNALQQTTGLIVAMSKVKPRHIRNGLVSYAFSHKDTIDMIMEKSEWMRSNQGSNVYETNQAIERIVADPNTFEKAQDFAAKHTYFLQIAFQNMVNSVVWMGAYEQALEAGLDDMTAIRQADSAVSLTQGTTNPEDISSFETGTATQRVFTQFAGYFNMLANLNASEIFKIQKDIGLRNKAGRYFYLYLTAFMLPAVMSEMIVRTMSGKGLDADDDDEYLDDALAVFFGSQFKTTTAMVPVLGPAANSAYNRFNNNTFDDRMSLSPVLTTIETTAGVPHEVYKSLQDKRADKKRVTKDVLMLIGTASSLPIGPIGRPVGYAMDVSEGKVRPSGPMDYGRGLITGTGPRR